MRVHLAKFPDWLEDIHTNDLSIRGFAWDHVVPYLANHGFPRNVCPEGQFWCVPDDAVPPEYIELADDPALRALLIHRRNMMWMSARDHEDLRDESGKLLEKIRARLTLLEN